MRLTPDDLAALHPLLVGFCAAAGLILGSFLNVVAYRVPAGQSVVTPRSACPHCAHPIRGYDNVPVLSWLVLRGRCRDCAAPIAWRYPAVEATTGALFGGAAAWLGFDARLPFLLWAAAAGVALFLIDLDTFRLPDKVSVHVWAAAAAGSALLAAAGVTHAGASGWALLGRVGASALLWGVVFFLPWLLTGGRGMGFGDVKLAPALGALAAWFGWGSSVVGLFSGFILGGVIGMVLMARGKAGRKTKVPYGPYLLTGWALGVTAGPVLWRGYLTLFGL